MPSIRILDEAVRSRIAAGEVVERPANVAKELVENALDAAASRVDVEFRGGGVELIRVADDGCGMEAGDLALSVERHATSKLSQAEDIYRIATLGFRGEALPSIGSVSRLRIATRQKGAPPDSPPFAVEVVGGDKGPVQPCALEGGTVVEVRDLFFNLPVRARFLKSEAAESAAFAEAVTGLALSRPDVAFSLRRDSHELLRTPGGGDLRETIASAYGESHVSNLLPVQIEGPAGFSIDGWASRPSFHKPNRSGIHFFVNRRFVKDRLLASALEEAYRGLLPPRRHPVAFLCLALDPGEVDVNIHPTKAEIRFRNSGLAFALVQSAIRQMLAPPFPAPPRGLPSRCEPGGAPEVRSDAVPPTGRTASRPAPGVARTTYDLWQGERPLAAAGDGRVSDGTAAYAPAAPAASEPARRPGAVPQERSEAAPSPSASPAPGPVRIVGQAGGAYIVFEDEEGLYVADQHALHERILFERLSRHAEKGSRDTQGLLVPVTVELSPEAAAHLPAALGLIESLGFDIEAFGPRSLLLRGVPAVLGRATALDSFLVETLDRLRGGLRTDPAALREKALAMMACKAATKAGERLTSDQMRSLVEGYRSLVSPRGFTCPHGRPTAVEMTWEELGRKVGR